jgi:hypothetical protein
LNRRRHSGDQVTKDLGTGPLVGRCKTNSYLGLQMSERQTSRLFGLVLGGIFATILALNAVAQQLQ